MRASSNAVMGSSALTTALHTRPDGKVEATCPTCPAIPAQVGDSVRDASERLRRAYEDWVIGNCQQRAR